MPDLIRLTIADTISRRLTRSSLVVYGVAAVCFILFLLIMTALQPSFLLYVAAALFFMLGLLVCIMRNPLGVLTMRVQKKLAAGEFVFTPEGLTVINLSGDGFSFNNPQAELIFLSGPGGCDYYLLVKAGDGKTGRFYVGNDFAEVERLAELLEQSGALTRYEKPPQPDAADLVKSYKDRFFD